LLALGDPNQAVFFGSMGIAAALVFANLGSAYGTAKSGVGIVSVAVLKPDLLFKSIIPVVMAGVLGMYGMIIAILMKQQGKLNLRFHLYVKNPRCLRQFYNHGRDLTINYGLPLSTIGKLLNINHVGFV
jgi:ATP synthase proteolipid subunit